MVLTRNAYTRVTLALDIVRPVPDGIFKGFHELGAIKHQIDLCDTVSVKESLSDGIECDDPAVPCDGRNACLKVSGLLKKKFGIDRSVRISLRKRIPVMGGLAGGSADAAATLALLNDLWELGLTTQQMIEEGRNVGMDVPYYFVGGTAFDSEAGLQLEPILTGCSFVFVLACPDFGVSTKEAYAEINYATVGRRQDKTGRLRKALEKNDMDSTIPLLHNDFELSIFSRLPRLSAIRQELLSAGCRAAHLTGSGSTVIGVARDRVHAEEIGKKVSCRTIVSSTLAV